MAGINRRYAPRTVEAKIWASLGYSQNFQLSFPILAISLSAAVKAVVEKCPLLDWPSLYPAE